MCSHLCVILSFTNFSFYSALKCDCEWEEDDVVNFHDENDTDNSNNNKIRLTSQISQQNNMRPSSLLNERYSSSKKAILHLE